MPFPTRPDSQSRGPGVSPTASSRTLVGGSDEDDAGPEDLSDEELDDGVRHDRWAWAFGLAALLVGTGLATTSPVLVVAGVVPLLAVAYAGLATLPEVALSVSRSIDLDPTAPGEPVEVELTVTNESDARLADVRLVDLVPDATPVQSGTPRAAVSLGAGESHTLSYTLSARRGVHEFGGVRVRVRNAAGTGLVDRNLAADGDDELVCELPVEDVPLADDTTSRAGAVGSDEHGEGLEFYGVREYRTGDDLSDVDWRRYARTGELTTVRYREERAATIVLVVDARDEAYVAASSELPSVADLSAYAAERAIEALVASYHEVGLAALFPGSVSYVEPGTGTEPLSEAREVLERAENRSPLGTVSSPAQAVGEASRTLQRIEQRIPGRAQIVLFSPATDRFTERLSRGLLAHGYPVTLVAPEVATESEPEQQVLAAERERRLLDLRGAGAGVVEWNREDPLPLVLERAMAGGGRA